MDNPNREKFGRRYEIKILENGMSQLSHIEKNIPPNIIPSNSLNDAYVQLCHCSAPVDGGYHFDMSIRMSENYGHLNITSFTKILKKKKRRHKSDPEFQKLVEELWEKDVDRVDESAITLNWQGKLEKKQVKDISPDPLFSSVDESIFQKPIYAALLEMYKENNFYQQVCEQEPPMNEERREKFVKIWGLITDSEVFKLGYEFLRNHGKTDKNFDEFREQMFDFWFGTYSRCEQHENSEPLGSSGFEHVFSGEWKQGTGVEGHHNWLRYYLGEKAGEINYYGYFEHQNNNILGTFQYKWKGFLKRIGGFFFRTSPAFDFTLFTVAVENYAALKDFFNKYPSFKSNPFYLAGESYAAVYIPILAGKILEGNKATQINLKGVAIGNGALSDSLNTNTLPMYLYSHDGCDIKGIPDESKCGSMGGNLFAAYNNKLLNIYNIYENCEEMANFIKTILNANIRVIFYNGDLDMRCNMLMGQRFTEQLGYKLKTMKQSWIVNGQIGGFKTEYENGLTFTIIRGAGHAVPQYKPQESLYMFKQFLDNKPL
uniref:Endoribonuclease n=1 Tax=Meloidogyne javanica TaxID=6303 RepID=A0A915MJU0_MELJA